tara:strand:- start:5048 stop:6133 length:1086 start_codon:yes stop_codon:yes gene_type:complete
VFSDDDAELYHVVALNLANDSFQAGIAKFLLYGTFEDLGAILFMSTLYKIVASNLFVNLIYLLSGVLASFYIFRIGRKLMSHKYAFIAAIAYSISSFVLWFHASGLKESIMIFLIIFFYDQYYKFITRKRIFNIILMILSLLSILLFRPAITVLILASIFSTLIFSNIKSRKIFIVLPFFFILFFFTYDYIGLVINKFIDPDGMASMLQNKEASGMVKLSIPFTIAVNTLAASIGPLPTIIPNTKIVLSFYSVGLIFRVLLSFAFWLGVYYANKNKVYKLFPLIFFVIFESFSLSYILEALELRKSLPHFFAIFLVSFWFLDFFNSKDSLSFKSRKKIIKLFKFSTVIFFLFILLWNLKAV